MRKSRKMQKLIERMAKARDVDLGQPGAHFRAESPSYMDLVVESVGVNQVSVTHYYEQSGDLCQDPEIIFLVGCDGEWYAIEWTTPPVMLMGRVMGGYRRYVEIDAANGSWKRANRKGQRDLAIFANNWADNLRMQGFK